MMVMGINSDKFHFTNTIEMSKNLSKENISSSSMLSKPCPMIKREYMDAKNIIHSDIINIHLMLVGAKE